MSVTVVKPLLVHQSLHKHCGPSVGLVGSASRT